MEQRRREARFRRHRQYMTEFCLDDRLVQCYSIPKRATGRIGFVGQGTRAVIGNLRARQRVLATKQER